MIQNSLKMINSDNLLKNCPISNHGTLSLLRLIDTDKSIMASARGFRFHYSSKVQGEWYQ